MNGIKGKAETGFYLLEAMLALALFALLSTPLLMSWQHLIHQKIELQMLSYALDIVQDELELFRQDSFPQGDISRQVNVADFNYQVDWQVRQGGDWAEGVLVIKWQIPGGKDQEKHFTVYRTLDKQSLSFYYIWDSLSP